jgi:hypothetical protein
MTDTRNCLRCNTSFPSSGPGNRLCSICNHYNQRRRNIKVHRCDNEPPPPPDIPIICESFLDKEKKNTKKGSP